MNGAWIKRSRIRSAGRTALLVALFVIAVACLLTSLVVAWTGINLLTCNAPYPAEMAQEVPGLALLTAAALFVVASAMGYLAIERLWPASSRRD